MGISTGRVVFSRLRSGRWAMKRQTSDPQRRATSARMHAMHLSVDAMHRPLFSSSPDMVASSQPTRSLPGVARRRWWCSRGGVQWYTSAHLHQTRPWCIKSSVPCSGSPLTRRGFARSGKGHSKFWTAKHPPKGKTRSPPSPPSPLFLKAPAAQTPQRLGRRGNGVDDLIRVQDITPEASCSSLQARLQRMNENVEAAGVLA